MELVLNERKDGRQHRADIMHTRNIPVSDYGGRAKTQVTQYNSAAKYYQKVSKLSQEVNPNFHLATMTPKFETKEKGLKLNCNLQEYMQQLDQ